MEKTSVTLREEDLELLEDVDADNRSEALRTVLDEFRELQEDVDELRRDLEHQEARTEDLRRQLQEARSREDDVDELATYVEDERRYRRAGIVTRAKWWLRGMDDVDDDRRRDE